jgi:hypothetical protein
VQLAGRELTDLWMPKPAAGTGGKGSRHASGKAFGKYQSGDDHHNSHESSSFEENS